MKRRDHPGVGMGRYQEGVGVPGRFPLGALSGRGGGGRGVGGGDRVREVQSKGIRGGVLLHSQNVAGKMRGRGRRVWTQRGKEIQSSRCEDRDTSPAKPSRV